MDKPLGELDDSCWRDEAEQAQICDDNLSIFSIVAYMKTTQMSDYESGDD